MRRWILHAHSVLGLSLADECFGSVCAVDDMDQDLFKAFDPSVEEDAGSLQLLQVARVASSELLKSSTSGRSLQVESTNSTSSLEMTLPASWWQETMRAAINGRTMTPILILVGLALGLGMLILVVLQWLDAKKSSQRRGILRAFCDGERVYGSSKSTRSLPEDYAQLFEARTFAPKGRWSYPGMGASFTPGPKAATAELLVSKCTSTA